MHETNNTKNSSSSPTPWDTLRGASESSETFEASDPHEPLHFSGTFTVELPKSRFISLPPEFQLQLKDSAILLPFDEASVALIPPATYKNITTFLDSLPHPISNENHRNIITRFAGNLYETTVDPQGRLKVPQQKIGKGQNFLPDLQRQIDLEGHDQYVVLKTPNPPAPENPPALQVLLDGLIKRSVPSRSDTTSTPTSTTPDTPDTSLSAPAAPMSPNTSPSHPRTPA